MGQTTQRGIKEQNCLDLVKRGFFWRDDVPVRNLLDTVQF